MPTFQDQLDEAFPPDTDAALVRCVSQAIMLANDTMASEPFLNSLIGGDIRGHIRRAAVLFGVHEACRRGDLPFVSEMSRMPLGGGHWVELRSGAYRAQVCRTDGPVAFPEETPTRQDERLSNQLEIVFEPSPVVIPIRPAVASENYAWLTFGAEGRELTHLCWGMPEARRNNWLARTNVLRRLGAAEVRTDPPDAPSPAVVLRFRDHIEEELRRDDGTSGTGEGA